MSWIFSFQEGFNVLAMLLVVMLFVAWTFIGRTVLVLIRRPETPAVLLLSPVVGLVAMLLPLMWLNRFGLPVKSIAWPVTLTLLVLATGLQFWLRPSWPLRRCAPFFAIMAASLLWIGYPLFSLGFDWLSYANDDMANYCLLAQRLVDHGFYQPPDIDALCNGTDYCQFSWFMHVPGMNRSGTDLLLACVCSLTGLKTQQAFMPVILAFHLTLLSVTSAFLWSHEARYRTALFACFLLALSPLAMLGVYYQLFAQVVGVALLVAVTMLLTESWYKLQGKELGGNLLLSGCVLAALLVTYPEVFPFAVVVPCWWAGLLLYRRELLWWPLIRYVSCLALIAAVGLNCVVFESVLFLSQQGNRGEMGPKITEIFPYYVTPKGFSGLWGLQPLTGGISSTIVVAACVVGGFALCVIALRKAFASVRLAEPVCLVVLVMTTVSLYLLTIPDGFGLFKIAMFAQPFLMGTLALRWSHEPVRWRMITLGLLLLVGNTYTGYFYGRASLAEIPLFAQLPVGTDLHVVTQVRKELERQPMRRLYINVESSSIAKLALADLPGMKVRGSRDFDMVVWTTNEFLKRPEPIPTLHNLAMGQQLRQAKEEIIRALDDIRVVPSICLFDPDDPSAALQLFSTKIGGQKLAHDAAIEPDGVLAAGPRQSVLNRSHFAPDEPRDFFILPWQEVANQLSYQPYFDLTRDGYEPRRLSGLKQPMADYFFPAKSVVGARRWLVFEVLRPSDEVRLVVNMTRTVIPDGHNALPAGVVVGEDRQPIGLVGSGTGRMVSPPIRPLKIDGRAYIAVDFGPPLFAPRKSIPKYYRPLAGLLRDLSVISQDDYVRLEPPSGLQYFPADLTRPGFEFSGTYEDGWLSDHALFVLQQPAADCELVVDASYQQLAPGEVKPQSIEVLVDGRIVAQQSVALGEFVIRCPAPDAPGRRQVELKLAYSQPMPGDNPRPVSVFLKKMAFEPIGQDVLARTPDENPTKR